MHALNAPFDVERPEGKFAERLMEAADEFASDTIGFWVGVGLREKHERGLPLGRVPETFIGVRTATSAKGSPIYEYNPHPELSAIVLEGARRYLTGRRRLRAHREAHFLCGSRVDFGPIRERLDSGPYGVTVFLVTCRHAHVARRSRVRRGQACSVALRRAPSSCTGTPQRF